MTSRYWLTTMSWRTHVSVLFLLAVSASVVAELTEYLQEIHVDITPSENVDDRSRHDSTRDTAADRHQKPTRRRRMLTDFDRRKIIDTLNRLRRSLGAPDMYYAVCINPIVLFLSHCERQCECKLIYQNPLMRSMRCHQTGETLI